MQVRSSLELACAKAKEEIVKGFSCNRILVEARPYLEHLHLLYDALRLEDVKQSYFGALEEIMAFAVQRKQMVLEAMENESFCQAQGFVSIFNCELASLAPHIARLDRSSEDLDVLKKQSLQAINNRGKEYVLKVEQALTVDDFDGVARILVSSEKLLSALQQYLPQTTKDAITKDAIQKIRTRTDGNRESTLQLIEAERFDAELARLLNIIQAASQNETILQRVLEGAEEYTSVKWALNACLVKLADELKVKLEREDAAANFEARAGELAKMLDKIDAADQHLGEHVSAEFKESRLACRRTFAEFKDRTFKALQEAVENSTWDEAHWLFKCMKAASMGSSEEKTTVESRLEGQAWRLSIHRSCFMCIPNLRANNNMLLM